MKPLTEFADRHAVATGTIGVASGIVAKCVSSLLSSLLLSLHVAALIAADLAILVSFGTCIFTFLIVFRRWRRNRGPHPPINLALEPEDDELP